MHIGAALIVRKYSDIGKQNHPSKGNKLISLSVYTMQKSMHADSAQLYANSHYFEQSKLTDSQKISTELTHKGAKGVHRQKQLS